MSGGPATTRCSRRCGSTSATPSSRSPTDAGASPRRSRRWPIEQGEIAMPGYTHMQQAMPSSVALWARGFAAEIRDDVDGLRHAHRRIVEEPAGLGRRLRHAQPAHRSRGHAREARLPGEPRAGHGGAALARQGRGRGPVPGRAADAGPRPARRRPAALLHARVRLREAARRVHDRLVDHAAEAQSRTSSNWCAAALPRRRPAWPKCSASPPSCRPATSATCS